MKNETCSLGNQQKSPKPLNDVQPDGLKFKYSAMSIEELKLGDVESAFTSSAMMNKIMYDKKKQMKGKKNGEKKE